MVFYASKLGQRFTVFLSGFTPVLIDYGQEGVNAFTTDPLQDLDFELADHSSTLIQRVYNNGTVEDIKELLQNIVTWGLPSDFQVGTIITGAGNIIFLWLHEYEVKNSIVVPANFVIYPFRVVQDSYFICVKRLISKNIV